VPPAAPPELAAPAAGVRLLSAQLSKIEFYLRVLEQAQDRSQPLLERLRALAFTHEHLDEFFEIHVSGLRAQREGVQAGTAGLLPDGRTPTEALAAVEARLPPNLPRLVPVPTPGARPAAEPGARTRTPSYFVWLESLIAAHLDQVFLGVPVSGSYAFRVTRDYDQDIAERQAEDLLSTVQQSIRDRYFGIVVRLEFSAAMPESVRARLIEELGAGAAICYSSDLPLGLRHIMALHSLDRPDLKYPPFKPRVPPARAASRAAGDDIFAVIRERDVLLHHPFDSFAPVVQFIEAAAADPDVLAIKQTLYRIGENSPIVEALMRAREKNKQVAVLLELKARGDEENNIEWAQAMERVGIHVVYGIIGLKTHCKATLVVRRDADGIRRYAHLGTGNYNASTARGYTDVCLFTCRPEIGADLSDLFNYLTGYSRQDQFRSLLVAPTTWRRRLVELIDREIAWQARGEQGAMIFKANGLTDPQIIELLYRASQAGVQIDLIIRDMCCLRPGVPGLSENIRVVSVVGRFLEHSRLFYFRNGGRDEVYLGSADLMPRNLDRRVEILFPVLDDGHRAYLHDEVLRLYLADTVRARELQPDGSYLPRCPAPGANPVDAQAALLAAARTA
jgi:polyphosphate kinase